MNYPHSHFQGFSQRYRNKKCYLYDINKQFKILNYNCFFFLNMRILRFLFCKILLFVMKPQSFVGTFNMRVFSATVVMCGCVYVSLDIRKTHISSYTYSSTLLILFKCFFSLKLSHTDLYPSLYCFFIIIVWCAQHKRLSLMWVRKWLLYI